jgi:hypothetical protein
VAANILHANRNPISEAIAGWPPVALLLTVELVSRVPLHRRFLAAIRILATAVISGIAAWVSYWHMVGVASRYGETDASPYLLPISVDGLIVVASISLVELAGRIRNAEAGGLAGVEPSAMAAPAETATALVANPAASRATAGVPANDETLPSPELLSRARAIATAHRRTNWTDITPDQLAAYMRISPELAAVLHGLVVNDGTGNGHRTPIGELTR